jgi:hypothetical protein
MEFEILFYQYHRTDLKYINVDLALESQTADLVVLEVCFSNMYTMFTIKNSGNLTLSELTGDGAIDSHQFPRQVPSPVTKDCYIQE